MDKNAIKKYAVWARRELISRVSQKAQQFGISEKNIVDAGADSVNGHLLSADEKMQRQALSVRIKQKGYEQVMEEVAYTWFNRFSALRFMEVNGYLPTRVRVFTDEDGVFKPQILAEAIHLDLDGLDMKKVYAYKEASNNDELYKYLLVTQCNALSAILPGMFQRIADYTELLFPDNLLREGSVLEQMVTLIPEADWQDQVQIIGWLYQYYNSEPKDKVFADLKKNIKISKENIPAATQLFTPDWIVRYMVENSLGRLWVNHLEGDQSMWHIDDGKQHSIDEHEPTIAALKLKWKYYLEEAKQPEEIEEKLWILKSSYADLKPEDIRCIDPCMGSGHILVYMFDVLMQIYEAYGYRSRDAVQSIVHNNLYGLDIDDRAAQLAYFSVMMKARQYDSRFFTRGIAPNVYAICESNGLDPSMVEAFIGGDAARKKAVETIFAELHDAKEYGSILNVTPQDFSALYARVDEMQDEINMFTQPVWTDLLPLIRVAEALAQKYDVVVTNPPYMGSSGMSAKLGEYVKKNYPDSKSDLFAVFIERCGQMTKKNGYQAMITQHAWMFLSSFEKLRAKLLNVDTVNMAHLGARAFEEIGGEVVQATSFVLRNSHTPGYKCTYYRLIEPTSQQGKEDMFLAGENRFDTAQDNFSKIPGSPIAYWVSEKMLYHFLDTPLLDSIAAPCAGLATGDNTIFQRFWYEVSYGNIGFDVKDTSETLRRNEKWYPCNSGGEFRKWSTDDLLVVDWKNDGTEIKQFRNTVGKLAARPQNTKWYFKEGLTWNKLSSSRFAVKYKRGGFIFDDTSRSAFVGEPQYLRYYIGLLCSCVVFEYLKALNPTMSFTNGDLIRIPCVFSKKSFSAITEIVNKCIDLSKEDWDSFETSWDFSQHPLVLLKDGAGYGTDMCKWNYTVSSAYGNWEKVSAERFATLKANEEELNRIFIDIYGLQDELTPEVEDKDVTVRLADKKRDIRSLISYAVGCMFGRYSLDVDGLVFAGGDFDKKYCRWISLFGDKADDSIDEDGNLIDGGWAGCSMWKYDGIRIDGKWKAASFAPDTDNIIPICDDEYFDDDISGRFVRFIETIYGKNTLDENLRFIADALGGSGQPKEVIRNYFLNDFYADHLKIYQKRPIYWLFDSGKKNGFKALIYMHRYAPDTIARMRTDYVHEQQARYHTALSDLDRRVSGASGSERVKLSKQLTKLQEQIAETRIFEEKIHHLADQMIHIDLDDGVKHNYEIFGDVLAKIK